MATTRPRKLRDANKASIEESIDLLDETSNGFSSSHDAGETLHAASSALHVPDLIDPGPVPQYTIDMSLPPRQRYASLASAYKHKMVQLPQLFDELLENLHAQTWFIYPWPIKQLAKLLLRRVYDSEQMEELIGIQEATGIEMYLLVAFNVLLDMLVGCTSGGVRVSDGGRGQSSGTKMLHFRTLDWAMDPLRQIVVELAFVTSPGGPVIARSITYLGFVGVLTAVRPGLSISFNFRYNLKSWQMLSWWEKMQYMGGKFLVLLGQRPSIPCTLRKYMIPDTHLESDWRYVPNDRPQLPTAEDVVDQFPSLPTAQCFVIVSNGDTTTIIEKDWKSAAVRSDSSFVACTNHDEVEEHVEGYTFGTTEDTSLLNAVEEERKEHIPDAAAVAGMNEILEESVGRKRHIEKNWERAKENYIKKHPDTEESDATVLFAAVKRWLTHERITSPCTHFSVIMDPTKGEIKFAERYPTPDWESINKAAADGTET